MTEAEITSLVHRVAAESAKEAVRETLTALGIQADAPFEVQADMQYLRGWRQSIATVKKQGLVTAVGIMVAGFLALLISEFHNRG